MYICMYYFFKLTELLFYVPRFFENNAYNFFIRRCMRFSWLIQCKEQFAFFLSLQQMLLMEESHLQQDHLALQSLKGDVRSLNHPSPVNHLKDCQHGTSHSIAQSALGNNAANVMSAVQMTEWFHLPCFVHSWNLVLQSGLKQNRPELPQYFVAMDKRRVTPILKKNHR